MKLETIQKLDNIAKACVNGLETEIRCGLTTRASVREIQSKTKNPTHIEVIKSMLRADLKRARSYRGAGSSTIAGLENVMKSSEQSNYLANAIDSRIKRRAWSDKAFDGVYRELFGVRPRARSVKNV